MGACRGAGRPSQPANIGFKQRPADLLVELPELAAQGGRPVVRLLLPTHIALPADERPSVILGGAEMANAAVRALDAQDGSVVALAFAGAGSGRRLELTYQARLLSRGRQALRPSDLASMYDAS